MQIYTKFTSLHLSSQGFFFQQFLQITLYKDDALVHRLLKPTYGLSYSHISTTPTVTNHMWLMFKKQKYQRQSQLMFSLGVQNDVFEFILSWSFIFYVGVTKHHIWKKTENGTFLGKKWRSTVQLLVLQVRHRSP